jgi:hypothetical protein
MVFWILPGRGEGGFKGCQALIKNIHNEPIALEEFNPK